MKLAAITDEISQDFEHALDVMLEYGAKGAELRGLWNTNIADLTDAQAARAKAALQARNMTVVGLATPFYKCDLALNTTNEGEAAGRMHLATPRGLEQQMDMLRRCIHLARYFDTSLLRIFTFWRKAPYTPAIEDQIVAALNEPVEIAAREGMTLLLENEHACYIGTGDEAARLLSEVNSPNLKAAWDPGNAYAAGERPYPDGYEAIKRWLGHVHVKDCRMVDTPDHGPQAKWCVIGEGEIDYVGQFDALRRDHYTGYISLETHYVPATGTGENGAGTPEDGSRPCLAALQRMLAV